MAEPSSPTPRALRRQEIAFVEYQRRFQAFEAAVGDRLKAMAREERNARFHAALAVETKDDLVRLAVVAIRGRRRAHAALRHTEAALMARWDKPMRTTGTAPEPSRHALALQSVQDTLAAVSPARLRRPLVDAVARPMGAVRSYRTAIQTSLAFCALLGLIGWLLVVTDVIDDGDR